MSLAPVPSPLEGAPVSDVLVEEDHEGPFSSYPSELQRKSDCPMP